MLVKPMFEVENNVASVLVEQHRDTISGDYRTRVYVTLWNSDETYSFSLNEALELRNLLNSCVDRAIEETAKSR